MKNILLITLGHSPMIVPEAVWVMGKQYDEVHIITTDNKKLPENFRLLEDGFRTYFPKIFLTTTAVDQLELPEDSIQYAEFEEALFQWYLEKAGNSLPDVCISGGIKTMPATLQQAARYFGAADVFHVIANVAAWGNPKDFAEAFNFFKAKKINKLSLGAEPGWESLRHLMKQDQFSPTRSDEVFPGLLKKSRPIALRLSVAIRQIMIRVSKVSIGDASNNFPFSKLQLLTDEQLAWLNEPLNADQDRAWVAALPKTDLHCHLGGFATQFPLLNQVINAALAPESLALREMPLPPHGWPHPDKPISLSEYMRLGDANGSALLTDAGCLEKQIELMYAHFLEQNLRYVEVRCSPDNYQTTGRSAWAVLEDIRTHFERCMIQAVQKQGAHFCSVNLLVIVTRKNRGDLSSISRHIALAITASRHERQVDRYRCNVVGIDLAGFENQDTRAAYFAQDFIGVHRCGLAVTAHAGENDDAEGIWQAVYHLHARRIGHALSLLEAPDLIRTMADRRIGVEMCPYANYQIKGYAPMPGISDTYPLQKYLEKNLLVTVNTDNVGISAATVTENFLFLATLCPGIRRVDILQLVRNGIEVAFLSPSIRKELLASCARTVFDACNQYAL